MITPESKRVFFSFHNHSYRNSSQGLERNQVNDLKISCQTAGLLWGLKFVQMSELFPCLLYLGITHIKYSLFKSKTIVNFTNCLFHQFGCGLAVKPLCFLFIYHWQYSSNYARGVTYAQLSYFAFSDTYEAPFHLCSINNSVGIRNRINCSQLFVLK